MGLNILAAASSMNDSNSYMDWKQLIAQAAARSRVNSSSKKRLPPSQLNRVNAEKQIKSNAELTHTEDLRPITSETEHSWSTPPQQWNRVPRASVGTQKEEVEATHEWRPRPPHGWCRADKRSRKGGWCMAMAGHVGKWRNELPCERAWRDYARGDDVATSRARMGHGRSRCARRCLRIGRVGTSLPFTEAEEPASIGHPRWVAWMGCLWNRACAMEDSHNDGIRDSAVCPRKGQTGRRWRLWLMTTGWGCTATT
jgi:hypothetical protein